VVVFVAHKTLKTAVELPELLHCGGYTHVRFPGLI